MPRTRKREEHGERLVILLKGYGANAHAVSKELGYNKSTMYNHYKNPRLLQIGEVMDISEKFHIPIDEIRASIR